VTPTTRCAWLLAAVAVAGLLFPVWAAVAGALAVLAAMLVDGLSVRDAPRLERRLDEVLSRGVAATLSIDALTHDARRVLLRQPATATLRVHADSGAHDLRGELVPLTRGRHRLPGAAGASLGPLGLARWHHPSGDPVELLVYPDLPRDDWRCACARGARRAADGSGVARLDSAPNSSRFATTRPTTTSVRSTGARVPGSAGR
jgi:uncharacterized protein (DUF58 family)